MQQSCRKIDQDFSQRLLYGERIKKAICQLRWIVVSEFTHPDFWKAVGELEGGTREYFLLYVFNDPYLHELQGPNKSHPKGNQNYQYDPGSTDLRPLN